MTQAKPPIPLIDLDAQYRALQPRIEARLQKVLTEGRFILGPEVAELEESLARFTGARHAISVANGTDALKIALMAEGIGPGDEVVTTPYSFFATAGVITRVGATPVFVDVDPVTLNLDPARVADSVTKRTRAIIPVHIFGQMAEMTPIMEIARSHGLVVIEDAAQAIGAEHEGRRAGSIGHYGCFSFFPSKNLGCFGDGGMVVTDDAARADRVRALRVHGEGVKYHHRIVGGNFRLDALQAAVVRAKLPHLDGWSEARRANAALYSRLLEDLARREPSLLTLPRIVTDRHVFNQYVVRVADRDRVREQLAAAGIGTAIYYPLPLHLQKCFAGLGYRRGDLPESERAAERAIALPIYPELTTEQIHSVAGALQAALGGRT